MLLGVTPESTQEGEFSVLATVETLLAVGFSIAIATHLNTLWHLAIGASIAPFLLLRTNKSCLYALTFYSKHLSRLFPKDTEPEKPSYRDDDSWLDRAWKWVDGQSPLVRMPCVVFITAVGTLTVILVAILVNLYGIFQVATLMLVRLWSTFRCVLRHPLTSVRNIPDNWWRVCFATSIFSRIEILPAPERSAEEYEELGVITLAAFADLRYKDYDQRHPWPGSEDFLDLDDLIVGSIFHGAAMVAAGLAAVVYRVSLKSTAIVWFPLLWAAQATHGNLTDADTRTQLAYHAQSDRWRIAAALAIAPPMMLLAKIVWWNEIAMTIKSMRSSVARDLLEAYVAPTSIPIWQLAAVLNAVIAISCFLYVREHWLRVQLKAERASIRFLHTLLLLSVARRILAAYTAACLLYLIGIKVQHWRLPPIRPYIFPWMSS